MATVAASKLSAGEKTSLAAGYAVLLLTDSGKPLTHENIEKVLNASGVQADKNFLNNIAKALEGKNVKDWFSSVGGGQGSAPAQ